MSDEALLVRRSEALLVRRSKEIGCPRVKPELVSRIVAAVAFSS